LTCGTNYTLGVDSYDAAGNRSPQAVVMVSTMPCSDTQAPSTPAGLTVSGITQTTGTLGWSASQDNVGVAGYEIFRNSAKLTTTTGVTSPQSGLTCNTAYTFGVVAYDAAGNRSSQAQVVTQTAACSTSPTPPPTSGVVELSGTVSPSTLAQRISSAPAGPVTVRPQSGATVTVSGNVDISRSNVTLDRLTVNGVVSFDTGATGAKLLNSSTYGFGVYGADNVSLEGNTFDGRCQRAQNWVIENPVGQVPNGTTIRNNMFRNYYMCSDSSAHTEALFIAYSDGGLIEGNTFDNNGTTSHIFFSYVGANGSLNTGNYARNWCVRSNRFLRAINPWYSIQFRQENPASANTSIDPSSNTSDRTLVGPTTTEAARHTRSC
jgi:chitodextrinase